MNKMNIMERKIYEKYTIYELKYKLKQHNAPILSQDTRECLMRRLCKLECE